MIRRILTFALAALVALAPVAEAQNFSWTQLQSVKQAGFFGTMNVPAVAADFSCAEIFNPNGSGKILLFWSLNLSNSVSGTIQVGTTTTALTSIAGNPAVNKYAGASASVVQMRFQNATSIFVFPGTGDGVMISQAIGANLNNSIPFIGPVVVPANQGFVTCSATANTLLLVTFEWDEVPG